MAFSKTIQMYILMVIQTVGLCANFQIGMAVYIKFPGMNCKSFPSVMIQRIPVCIFDGER